MPARHILFVLFALAWAIGLAASARAETAPGQPALTRIIYVASNGWHTAIIVPRAALPPGTLPEAEDFPDAPFLEFGWGDREYYPNPRPSLAAALAAGLLPGDSVMHLAGLTQPPRAGGGTEVVSLAVAEAGFARMIAGVDGTFDRKGARRAKVVAPGLHTGGNFYPAHGTFHLFNTCNTWVAERLEAAGVALTPAGVVTAGDLMERLRTALEESAAPAR